MRKQSNTRIVNGVISAIIVCFFAAHGILGSVFAVAPFESSIAWAVWIGMALVALHIIVSIVTSYQQLTDAEFPPSARKKRHLVLKWATGILLLVAVGAHVFCIHAYGAAAAQSSVTGAIATVAVAAMFAIHTCVGGKSLLKDIFVDRKYLMVYRVVLCVLAIVFACATIAGVAS